METKSVMEMLAEEYPQLYLDPDREDRQTYRGIVLQGEEPERKSLAHYCGDKADRIAVADTPAGQVRVVTLGNRRDFELVIRSLMAAKEGPEARVPATQGAAMLTVFNWPRINAHLQAFPEDQHAAEFKRFTSVRENYIDMLVVLSRGPYSGVDAAAVGEGQEEWIEHSGTIRRYHELTHVICRKLYPDNIEEVRDELVADAVGLYAAYTVFDPETEKLFLGIRDGKYVGGRLENYTEDPAGMVDPVCAALARMKNLIEEAGGRAEPFDLIPALMEVRV